MEAQEPRLAELLTALSVVTDLGIGRPPETALAPGLSVERATDLLWALGAAEMYRLLVSERGWAPEQYEAWLAAAVIHSLLVPGATPP